MFSRSDLRLSKLFFGRGANAPASPQIPSDEQRRFLHDLNNLLGVVIGSFDEQLELLKDSEPTGHDDLKKLAEGGLTAALRGADLVREAQARPSGNSGPGQSTTC